MNELVKKYTWKNGNKNLTATIFIVIMFAALAATLFGSVTVSADPRCNNLDPAERGLCLTDPAAWTAPGASDDDVLGIAQTIVNIFTLVVGVISVIMIIIGGLKYITSTGDAGKVDSAKNTILYAVVGLVIVVLAQVIVRFVLGEVT